MSDRWGNDTSGTSESIAAWDTAWDEFLHFHDDPMATLATANETDDTFVLGPVLCSLYNVTAGSPLASPAVQVDLARAISRASTDRDRAHAAALESAAAGNFTVAANAWADLAATGDFAAYRFAHDLYLHVGDADRRLDASNRSRHHWIDKPGENFIDGMHAFTLEESGRYNEAQAYGRTALEADPLDLWARHALAHVYEHTNDTDASIALLRDTTDVWASQDGLAVHVWWHLALRLLADGAITDVLEIFDDQLPSATTPFRLCDATSLLWRAELAGHDVGDRWDAMADRWDDIDARHTCGFLDLHAALAYIRRPGHTGAARWFDGLASRPHGGAEIDDIFRQVARPLIDGLRSHAGGDAHALTHTLADLGDTTARIGGSVAQREIITLTANPSTGAPS
jgi:tetratricopeptide (TPR) repeat protein